MNYRMILRTVGFVLSILAALMLLPLIAGVCYGESVAHFAVSIIITGALPFVLSGDIPNYLDAVFETVSGFTAALACISNIGPGMGQIGPASCFNIFSAPVKMVLAVIVLLGRLELYPILAFFAPTTWRK